MPFAQVGVTVTRPDLGETAKEFALERSRVNFIGLQILRTKGVQRKSATFPKIKVESYLKLVDTKRGPRSGYARTGFEFTEGNYSCKENGLEHPLPDAEVEEHAHRFNSEIISTKIVMDRLLRNQEKRIADLLFNGSTFTPTTVGTAWDNAAADVLGDVETGIEAIRSGTGIRPDVLALSWTTFRAALKTTAIKEAIKYTQAFELLSDQRQMQLLADYVGVQEVLVGDGVKNTAGEGLPRALSNIWDDDFGLLALRAEDETLEIPQIGRTFVWELDSPENAVVESYREEQTRSDIIRARQNTDETVINTEAAYLMDGLKT